MFTIFKKFMIISIILIRSRNVLPGAKEVPYGRNTVRNFFYNADFA